MRRKSVFMALFLSTSSTIAAAEQGRKMPLTNTQLQYYDSNVLRLPADKR